MSKKSTRTDHATWGQILREMAPASLRKRKKKVDSEVDKQSKLNKQKAQIAALKVPIKPGYPTKPEPGQDQKDREGYKPVPLNPRS